MAPWWKWLQRRKKSSGFAVSTGIETTQSGRGKAPRPPLFRPQQNFANTGTFPDGFQFSSDALFTPMNTRIADVALLLWNPDVIELVSLTLLGHDLSSKGIEPWQNVENM